jgi:bifunctional glutamyl/prolyl-tRNA synthetase
MMFIKYSNVFKEQIDKEVKSLLELKAEYKKQTGKDWTPDAAPKTASVPAAAPVEQTKPQESLSVSLDDKIKKVGDSVRALKAAKAPKVG